MKWVLIAIYLYNPGGVGVVREEFSSQEFCERAGEQLEDTVKGGLSLTYSFSCLEVR